MLSHGAPVEVGTERIVIGFPPGSFFGRQAEGADAKDAVADVAGRVLGARPRVEIVYAEAAEAPQSIAQEDAHTREAALEAAKKKALNHPIVLEAGAVFGFRPDQASVHVDLE